MKPLFCKSFYIFYVLGLLEEDGGCRKQAAAQTKLVNDFRGWNFWACTGFLSYKYHIKTGEDTADVHNTDMYITLA